MNSTAPPDPDRDLAPQAFAEAFAELLEAATLVLAGMVWSPEGLPMAERLAAALNRVTELAEGSERTEVGDAP